ncbi:cupin domain-containing protein [Mucilaginibacter sp. KACC 22063]|uniref:cupin domain-containing protein n=1 Tax=Mucilaginibacter sp. KACC 22063 TaxID=3025666 RepID=UPI0023672554|nr:cupin domain-containing protein [Mucilaginibacter sp. KACC 22063]WDF56255.1 cupin domain-containing protein [Mucilaginibacter sp. KACC 22063]
MDEKYIYSFNDIAVKEIAPGFMSKLIHTDTNTVNFIEVKAGCTVQNHQHIHEQMSFVLQGQFELTIEGAANVLDKGSYALIPSNAWHSGRAITDCKLIDIFSPNREDYMNL